MGRMDRGARNDTRQRRQGQRDAQGLGLEFGNGLVYDPDSGTVSLALDLDPALVFTDGELSVQLRNDGGLDKNASGLGIKLDTAPGLALSADGLVVQLNGTTLTKGASGLSVTAPEGRFVVTAVQTGAYNAAAGELVRCDPSGGTFDVTLPTAAAIAGRQIVVKNATSDTTAIGIVPDGSETIDGAASASITTAWGVVRLISDGTNWLTL